MVNKERKGGDVYRPKRMTKTLLCQIWKERSIITMPELGVNVVEGGDQVELNKPYEITNVSEVTTEVSFYQGIRVEGLATDASQLSIMLWKRQTAGTKSKLGAMIMLLGSNTDAWLHKWIKFTKWEKNARIVLLVAPPIEASTEATTAEGIAKAIKKAKQ